MTSNNTVRGASAVLVALGISACSPNAKPGPTAPAQETAVAGSEAPAATADTEFRDGEYSATGWYGSAPSHHDVTLTIDDNTITAVDITTPAENETSLGYQRRFAAALPSAVIGRNLAELTIDRVAGSSGCSEGFTNALHQIRDQAAL